MKMTKKQIKAMENLIAMSYTMNNKRNVPVGECESKKGYEIMSDCMGVIYSESVPELIKDKRKNTYIYDLIHRELEHGNYQAVDFPFNGTAIQPSKIGKIISGHVIQDGKQHGAIDLSAKEMDARYNSKYVRWAIDMCGKDVTCYLGYTNHAKYPCLYVNSGTMNLDEGIHVIVMPMRKLS